MSKILLRESYSKDWEHNDKSLMKSVYIPLEEKTIKLYEKEYSVLGGFKIPVWRINEKNRNGRVYKEDLAERICKENRITIGLDTHPPDDYEPKISDIVVIEKNPTIENTPQGKILFVEIHFIDEDFYRKVKRAIDLGFYFEQSSSGFGEINNNNEVVSETYELERYADLLVQDSSYNVVFSSANEIIEENKKEVSSSCYDLNKSKEKLIVKENNNTNIKATTSKEKLVMKLEDKKLFMDIKRLFKESSKVEDPKIKLSEMNEIMGYYEYFDDMPEEVLEYKKEMEAVYANTEKEISELADKGKEYDKVLTEKEETVKSLEEAQSKISLLEKEIEDSKANIEKANKQLDIAFNEMDEGKKVYQKLKALFENTVAESNTLVQPDDYIALLNENETLKKDLKEEEKSKDDEEEEKEDKDKEDKDKDKDKEEKKEKKKESFLSDKALAYLKEKNNKLKKERKNRTKQEPSLKENKEVLEEKVNSLDDKLKQEKPLIEAYVNELEIAYGKEAIAPILGKFKECRSYNQAQSIFYQNRASILDTEKKVIVSDYEHESDKNPLNESFRERNVMEKSVKTDRMIPNGWL